MTNTHGGNRPPKIGLRMIKSAVAVFLCLLIGQLRGGSVPFYSAIAAILCMQPYVKNSVRVALNRTIGTLIGGFAGMLILLADRQFIPDSMPVLSILLISAAIVPLIYVTVVCKKTTASYITCVVFLSITVSHAADGNPYLFALNRILDTLIGIFISLGVNMFRLPRHRNRDMLFVTDFDGTLTNPQGQLSAYTKVKYNRLLAEGAQIAIASARMPATLLAHAEGLEFMLPLIVLNGAALYDPESGKYTDCTPIAFDDAAAVRTTLSSSGHSCFTRVVEHDNLHIYHDDLKNPAEQAYFQRRRRLPMNSFVPGEPPAGKDVLLISVFDRPEAIRPLYEALIALDCAVRLHIVWTPYDEAEGFDKLEIYSAAASKAVAAKRLMTQSEAKTLVAFGDGENDLKMLQAANYGFAVANASDAVRQKAPCVIGPAENDAVVKTIDRLFHSCQPEKQFEAKKKARRK